MRAADACRMAEISYRQLDHWCSKGWILPYGNAGDVNPGSGYAREFSITQVRKAALMRCLTGVGFAPAVAERIAHFAIVHEESSMYLGHGVTLKVEPHDH